MKKRFLSLLMVAFSALMIFPYSAFAGNYRYCPNCGYVLHTTYKGLDNNDLSSDQLTGFYYLFDVCTECDYSHKEVRVGPVFLSNITHPGNTPDIPGYTAPGVPSVNATGELVIYPTVLEGSLAHYYKSWNGAISTDGYDGYLISESIDLDSFSASASYRTVKPSDSQQYGEHWFSMTYYFQFDAPIDGFYTIHNPRATSRAVTTTGDVVERSTNCAVRGYIVPSDFVYGEDKLPTSSTLYAPSRESMLQGYRRIYYVYGDTYGGGITYFQQYTPFYLTCTPLTSYEKTTSITVNNTTINGNIYYDGSTNLYYIYQDGNTVPVIYNPETNEYTVYDNDTNIYYIIVVNGDTPDPTPTPTPGGTDPTPSPTPGGSTDPTPTPPPGSGTDPTPTPGGNSPGNPFGDIFDGVLDVLQDVLGAILQVIWTLLSSLFGIITWLIEQLSLLVPFLPTPAVAALAGGVILVIIIKILRFIGGLLP